jgi:hypothetical protein
MKTVIVFCNFPGSGKETECKTQEAEGTILILQHILQLLGRMPCYFLQGLSHSLDAPAAGVKSPGVFDKKIVL